MSAIATIQGKLAKYPHLKHSVEGRTISVEPTSETGFTVWLTEKQPGFTVGFDGWHDEFDDEKDALEMFAFGLSEECRLKIVMRGDTPYSWTYETKVDEKWKQGSLTALFFTPFWKKKSIVYRQNHVIK